MSEKKHSVSTIIVKIKLHKIIYLDLIFNKNVKVRLAYKIFKLYTQKSTYLLRNWLKIGLSSYVKKCKLYTQFKF